MKLTPRVSSAFNSHSVAPPLRLLLAQRSYGSYRSYATQHGLGTTTTTTGPRRKTVTPFNDDGRVPWHQLSAGEKTARATQQSFNLGLMFVGFVLTCGVGYLLYTDVFSPDSKTAHFNRAVNRIKADSDCVALLGDSKHMEAHGEETMNKWRRARPIASSHSKDAKGNEHLTLHFYVHGSLNKGVVNIELVKRQGASDYEYKYFYVDVPGHNRLVLEDANTKTAGGSKKYKFFGVNWN
ncbi:import inner membrane translocase subunit tim-21 [Apiospora rasikravindrae]|uniref:Mitochondrial import inner membrane translocase subunit Tim21 n=1 Tax=Apiospora rasikravindrae TaxID=990691 RepID=A0ABR1TXQ7_9PEZI